MMKKKKITNITKKENMTKNRDKEKNECINSCLLFYPLSLLHTYVERGGIPLRN